jgi:hypothetical protein
MAKLYYRGMAEQNGKPKTGRSARLLGVRPNIDIITGDLIPIQDSPTHISILPRVTMSLEKYEAALTHTQKYWERVD